jgi:signal transduction histidine kinase
LDRAGLIPTLRWYIDGFVRRSGIDIELHADDIGRLPLEVETDLFRIVQEGLSNVLRHSGSRVASLIIKRQGDEVLLQIKDTGRGMPHARADSDVTGRFGIGIPSMRERVRRLSGHLEVRSADGVALLVRVPVPAEMESHETRIG